jgi:benzoyl-CoA 2,3-dioxygenase component B
VLSDDVYLLDVIDDEGRPTRREVPMRNALNEVLRDWYVDDCRNGIERWNKKVQSHGIDFEFYLPDRKFNRQIGVFSGLHFDPWGQPLSREEWSRRRTEWLPAPADTEYLKSIQARPVYEPGKFANYIAPPLRGINQKPIDFEYVRTEA